MKLSSELNGSVERSAGIWSENAAKYSVMVIDCVPGLVIERSVAQSPASERIEPAPGIMRAWKDGASRFRRIVPIFVPEVCVPLPVDARVTVFVPPLPQACVAVRVTAMGLKIDFSAPEHSVEGEVAQTGR